MLLRNLNDYYNATDVPIPVESNPTTKTTQSEHCRLDFQLVNLLAITLVNVALHLG